MLNHPLSFSSSSFSYYIRSANICGKIRKDIWEIKNKREKTEKNVLYSYIRRNKFKPSQKEGRWNSSAQRTGTQQVAVAQTLKLISV